MVSKILNKKNIPYFIIASLLIYIFMINSSENVEVVIPAKKNSKVITDPNPVILYDTIFSEGKERIVEKLVEVKNPVNEELLQNYNKAVDSLERLQIFKDAVTERKYVEFLSDSIITIEVESSVIGHLKKQDIRYETKPQKITFETGKIKAGVFIGGFTTLPLEEGRSPSIGGQIQLVNKKKVFSIGIDNKKAIHLGYSIKLF